MAVNGFGGFGRVMGGSRWIEWPGFWRGGADVMGESVGGGGSSSGGRSRVVRPVFEGLPGAVLFGYLGREVILRRR